MPLPKSACLLLLASILLGGATSCFWRSGKDAAANVVPAGATAVGIPKRMYGEPVICAVSGDVFSISKDSRSAMYHGRHYYFRDAQALKAFLESPEGYMPDTAAASATAERH